MNHPYLYPDQCEWCDDYHELRSIRYSRYINTVTDEEHYELEDDRDGIVSAL